MELEDAKKFIKDNICSLGPVIAKAEAARRYYEVKNDIIFSDKKEDKEESLLRNADNRVCSSFYPLLVDQKAAYMFTSPPLFDAGSKAANKEITKVLGDRYPKNCKKLCVSASNCGVSWIHYWEDTEAGCLKWGVLDGTQIAPVVSDSLEEKIYAVLRTYTKTANDGNIYVVYEIWNDKECEVFCQKQGTDISSLTYYNIFEAAGFVSSGSRFTNRYAHPFGRVPFIPFKNNDIGTTDLQKIKGLIDTYDKTYNGFANDLEDIQEVIMVLTGYSGTSRKELLEDIKKYKVIKLDDKDSGQVSTLNIEIPVEARKTMLEMTRKAIFTQGQGIDPERESFGDVSGEALKFLYSLLELKAGLMQTEFMLGFGEFVRVICQYRNIPVKDDIIQTWTRTSIQNDTETAEIAKNSVGIISNKTIIKNHPFVENPQEELELIKKEKEEAQEEYNAAFKINGNSGNTDDKNGGEE